MIEEINFTALVQQEVLRSENGVNKISSVEFNQVLTRDTAM